MPERKSKDRGSLLGVMAYVLVPGERRKQASGHFRKAGFEALKGIGTLAKPEERSAETGASERERIPVD